MTSKNQKLLESFTKFCKENPELRFYQCLRAWGRYSFFFAAKKCNPDFEKLGEMGIFDLYYKQGK